MRKGLTVSFEQVMMYIAAALISAILLSVLVFDVWQTREGAREGRMDVDMIRITQALRLAETGPAYKALLGFKEEYDLVTIKEDNITLEFRKLWVTGNPRIDGGRFDAASPEMDEVAGVPDVCILNDGDIELGRGGECSFITCSSGTCSNDATAAYGYICEGGVYTGANYFVRRERDGSCSGPHSGSFMTVNSVSCPDKAETGAWLGCSVRITYRCSGGSKDVSIEFTADDGSTASDSETFDCEDAVVSRAFAFTKRYDDEAKFPVDYEVTVEGSTEGSGEVSQYDP